MASRSVKPFLHGSLTSVTNRQTDRPCDVKTSVAMACIYAMHAMWVNNSEESTADSNKSKPNKQLCKIYIGKLLLTSAATSQSCFSVLNRADVNQRVESGIPTIGLYPLFADCLMGGKTKKPVAVLTGREHGCPECIRDDKCMRAQADMHSMHCTLVEIADKTRSINAGMTLFGGADGIMYVSCHP